METLPDGEFRPFSHCTVNHSWFSHVRYKWKLCLQYSRCSYVEKFWDNPARIPHTFLIMLYICPHFLWVLWKTELNKTNLWTFIPCIPPRNETAFPPPPSRGSIPMPAVTKEGFWAHCLYCTCKPRFSMIVDYSGMDCFIMSRRNKLLQESWRWG